MTFYCNGCETDRDFDIDFSILIISKWGEGIQRFCRDCRKPRGATPDVYWDGKPEHNLADDPHTGQPRVFGSKGEKAAYLRERGLQEAGDSVHGAPVMFHMEQNKKVDTRSQVQEALRKVSRMSPSYRRQEYLRIIKEGKR